MLHYITLYHYRYLTPATDVFALGILMFEVYRFNLLRAPHSCIVGVVNNNVNYHTPALEALSALDYSFLPSSGPSGGLKEILQGMMMIDVRTRVSTNEIANHAFFVTGAISFLRVVDTLKSRDVGAQSSLLLVLPQHLDSFPQRVLERTVLPTICSLTLSNPALWVHALHVHISLAQKMPLLKYKGDFI